MTSMLVAAITPSGEVSLSFCAGMLRLQADLARGVNHKVYFEFHDTLADALTSFDTKPPEVSQLIALDANISMNPEFVFENSPFPFVVGVYPVGIDWKRVEEKMALEGEDPSNVGLVYNVDLEKGEDIIGSRYLRVAAAKLGMLKLTRGALDDMKQRHGPTNPLQLMSDEAFCNLWGKDIHVDLHASASTNCLVSFFGCVGHRSQLR